MSLSLNVRNQARGWLTLLTTWCLPLGRIAGIPVLLHWSWFIAAVFEITLHRDFYESRLWNVAEYLTLFFIVLLHELGHALACRSVGGRVDRIILWPLGGIVALYPPPRPWPTLWSIAGGPLVNALLLPVSIWLTFYVFEVRLYRGMPRDDVQRFLLLMTTVNIIFLAFNLLPFYPLDGGQILHALLWFLFGRARSLVGVSALGVAGAIGFVVLLVVYRRWVPASGIWWLGAVALFLLLQAGVGLVYAWFLLRPGWENLAAALHYLQHEQPDAAIDECSLALERLGSDGAARCMAHQRRGAGYLLRGDYAQAAAEMTQGIDVAPHAALHFTCGEVHLLAGEYHAAIDQFSNAVSSGSFRELARHQQARAWYSRGEAHFRLGDRVHAQEDVKKAREIDSTIPEEFPSPDESEAKIRHVAWAIDACDVWLTLCRVAGVEENNRSNLLVEQGKFEEAVEAATQAIRLNPRLAFAYINRADALRQLGRLDEALPDAQKAIELDPSAFAALAVRGAVRRLQGDNQAALADFTASLRLNPKFVFAYVERLQAAFVLKDYPQAEADCETALRLAPKLTILRNYLGMIHASQGRHVEAIADYEQTIRDHPDEPFPHNNLAYVLSTCPRDEIRDGRRALAHAIRACELTEYRQPIILDTLATAHAAVGDFEEAIRWEMKALEDSAFEKEYGEKARRKVREYQEGRGWREDVEPA